jgi:predicted nucleotidyltransferase
MIKEDLEKIKAHCTHDIMYLTHGGSHAYGTNVEGSDIDYRGICFHTKDEILAQKNFEQHDMNEIDAVLYSNSKIIKLLLNCNPNVIEMLGTREEDILVQTDAGRLLRDNVDIFLSQEAIYSFGGYATAQLRRLQNALARDSYPQEEKERHILGSIKSQMNHLNNHYTEFGENIQCYIDKSDKEEYDSEIFMDIDLKHYPLRDFKNIYSEMHQVVKDYAKIGKRNNKKTESGLLKHAMHLVRLYLMCFDILEGRGIITYRPDREFLLDIRNGKYSYEDIFVMVDEYEAKLEKLRESTSLPQKPNYKKADELLMEINRRILNGEN